jgi:3D (Asp-Asp-Asp) domain-containing protein
VKAREVGQAIIALVVAAGLIQTGAAHLPQQFSPKPADEPFRHPPVLVYSEPMLSPLIVKATKALPALPRLVRLPRPRSWSTWIHRAEAGVQVPVTLTQYCLQGTTRRDHAVRDGIVAADPRVFPLAHYVEVFLGKKRLGRYLVDDTGLNVKGATLDIWTPNCDEARRFGRQWGTAMLVVKPER